MSAGSAPRHYGNFDLERVEPGRYLTSDRRYALVRDGDGGHAEWVLASLNAPERELDPPAFPTLTAAASWLNEHYPAPVP